MTEQPPPAINGWRIAVACEVVTIVGLLIAILVALLLIFLVASEERQVNNVFSNVSNGLAS